MDFQILLLPRAGYWSWVRASQDYILEFGPNFTSDPATAANHMAPMQVVTLPRLAGVFSGQDDILEWFTERYPEIHLDLVEADTPQAFREALQSRIDSNDQFGQKQRDFYLLWPTDYSVVTQPFGANPQIYTRFGMPGHEGLDIRALMNTNVYCCADGVVYLVNRDPKAHAYGIHIRIRHKDRYKTVYGHLAKSLVKKGDRVQAGQIIAKANSTGASKGSHLHLTLKREGATRRRETRYPKDVIDPTPYMVWPRTGATKALSFSEWPSGRCLVGLHGRLGGTLTEDDFAAIENSKVEALKVSVNEPTSSIIRLQRLNPALLLVGRLSADFAKDAVSPDEFIDEVEPELRRLYAHDVRYYEVHASPNLQAEGWRRTWVDGAAFAAWFREVVARLRRAFPEGQYGFPGLSPGGQVSGWREDAGAFLEAAQPAVLEADWVGVNCYWTDWQTMQDPSGGRAYEGYRAKFPEKLLFITEFANLSATTPQEAKAGQYSRFYHSLRGVPGVGAAFAYALSAEEGHDSLVWRRDADGAGEIASLIGQMHS